MHTNHTKESLIAFEDNIEKLYLDNKIPCTFHGAGGNEEQLLEIFKEIDEDDYVIGTHRFHYHNLLKGVPPEELTQKIVNGQSMFLYDRERNILNSAIIGGPPAIAVGIAWALKQKGSKQKVWCFLGDANFDNGHFFEAARYVEGFDLPCTFIYENNNISIFSSNEDRWGKTANIDLSQFKCIREYRYVMNKIHIRCPGMVDLGKLERKSDEEYFPLIPNKALICNKKYENRDISYKDAMSLAMEELAENPLTRFVGYNVNGKCGDMMGSLKNVKEEQKLEMPVAETLMTGLGLGMSLEGFFPLVYFERFDFVPVAMDAILNHVDKLERLSHGQYKVPLIFRVVVFDKSPFSAGPTHSQDLTEGFKKLLNMPILEPKTGIEVLEAYNAAANYGSPVMIIDRKSNY